MFRPLAVIALATSIVSTDARADLETFVEMCGGADSTAREVVHFCRKAIDTGRLGPQARAQVYANLSIGYLELEQYLGAIDAANRALADDPRMVLALLNRAKAYEKLQRLKDAAIDYETALAIDPRSAEAYLGRGAMLLSHGDPEAAILDLSQAIAIEPDRGVARFNRGIAYLQIGQPSRAEDDFTTLIRQNPRDTEAYMYRGQARAKLNLPSAAEDFDTAISLSSEWGMTWFVRGRYRDSQGNREAANGDFLRAYELGHNDPWLIERVREISG